MRQSGRVPQACTSHWPGLKPRIPRRTIFWYFPRATHSGGQGKVKVCPSNVGVGVGVATCARATLQITRSNKAMGTTLLACNNPEHAMLASPCYTDSRAPRWARQPTAIEASIVRACENLSTGLCAHGVLRLQGLS